MCNLASIALPRFVRDGRFDHALLHRVVKQVVLNLNRVIDRNMYPVEEALRSNMRHRPVGLGVQGLADTFCLLNLAFDSNQAAKLNLEIFETIYHAALERSHEIAVDQGPYSTFHGSPLQQGQFQFDLWSDTKPEHFSGRYDWELLRTKITDGGGVANSLLIAPMPTATTSQILRCNEAIEPFTFNIYTRRVSAGEFVVVNPYLVERLVDRGLWNTDIVNEILRNNGSVQSIAQLDPETKRMFQTAFELRQKVLIDLAADRGRFVDQWGLNLLILTCARSQSLNLFVQDPTIKRLTAMHQLSHFDHVDVVGTRTNVDSRQAATISALHRKQTRSSSPYARYF